MDSTFTYPKLRWPLDIRIEKIGTQDALVINCPQGISETPLILVPEVAPILGELSGTTSFENILDKFKPYGLSETTLRELITLLDQNLFLSNPRFFSRENDIKNDFRDAKTRRAALAGLSYPGNAGDLAKLVDGYLLQAGAAATEHDPLLLVSPHIDYRRGGAGYGAAYKNLKKSEYDIVLLIGTSHQYSRNLFHLTPKAFESPFGTLDCDLEFVTKLAALYGMERSFQDEFLHRREHSLELQIPFLQRVVKNPKIIPVLVGSFHHMLTEQRTPEEFPEYDEFVAALGELVSDVRRANRKILALAGVDMAHVGPYFGDEKPLTPEFMEHIRSRDSEYIETITKKDKRAMFSHLASDLDARRICGFPTMYTLLDLFDRLGVTYKANTLDYRQAVDYDSGCAVTFASISCS